MTKAKDFFYHWQFVVAVAVVLVLYSVDHWRLGDTLLTSTLKDVRKETYASLATIFGALFGFVMTAFSIVVSLGNTAVMAYLRKSNSDQAIVAGFTRTTGVVGIATIVSLASIFLDSSTLSPNRLCEYLALFFSVWAALGLVGIIFIMETLVVAVGNSDK